MSYKQAKSKIQKVKSSKSIANDQMQKKKDLQQGLSIRDNREENSAIASLQKHCDTCKQKKPIQRLKIYPTGEEEFSLEQENVDLDDATYEQLCEYLFLRRQQEVGDLPIEEGEIEQNRTKKRGVNRNYYFAAGDTDRIKALIGNYEKGTGGKDKEGTVICKEGEVKLIDADQKGTYGGLTTCITVTVYLANGKKVLSHSGIQMPIRLEQIKGKITEANSEVTEIYAAGVLELWSVNLRCVYTNGIGEAPIDLNKDKFRGVLSSKIGSGAVYIEDVDNKEHSVDARSTISKMIALDELSMLRFWVNLNKGQKHGLYMYSKSNPEKYSNLYAKIQEFMGCEGWAGDLASMYGWAGSVEKEYACSEECLNKAKRRIISQRNPPSYIS